MQIPQQKLFKSPLVLAAIASLAACQVASAALSVTASVGGGPLPNTAKLTFDGLPLGSGGGYAGAGVTVSFTPNAQVVSGSVENQYAQPYFSGLNDVGFGNAAAGPDGTRYLTTGRTGDNGSITFTFDKDHTYLGLVWGSTDDYNTLTFYDSANNVIGSVIPGTTTGMPNAGGAQGINGTYYVNITSDTAFRKVVATSGEFAFEMDNFAVVPEPSTYIAGGLALLPLLLGLRSRLAKK
ncbi:MAG: hypothetical protein KF833_03405 [Verrucomicrobiae bacterium]|nr:hypothetical protein [Verrucomicrobiae bacterium]